jgi:DNA segregation ATPase FtsK/SpoIIIE-like protein
LRQATIKKSAARRKSKTAGKEPHNLTLLKGLRESALVVLVAFGAYLMVALLSYDPGDPGWTHTGTNQLVGNLGGTVGAYFADLFFFMFGFLAYLAPLMVAYSGWQIRKWPDRLSNPWSTLGRILINAMCGLRISYLAFSTRIHAKFCGRHTG